MKNDNHGIAGVGMRIGMTFALCSLFVIQLVDLDWEALKRSSIWYAHSGFVMTSIRYCLPLATGIRIELFLKKAEEQGEMSKRCRYLCFDWILMLLLFCYVCLVN